MVDFYKYSKSEILKYFKINENTGILENDLEYKLKKYGKNIIDIKKDISFLELFLIQIKSFLNLLLLFLVIFAFFVWIYTNKIEHLVDSIIIFMIFLFNSLMGAYQNFSAKKIAQTLNKMLENKALVLRNSKREEINARDLFPSDIVYLSAGDKIPADCYILESEELKVDESLLTGESTAVNKKNTIIKNDVSIADMKNLLFMNSYIISGEAKAIVIQTGKNTEIGKIATSIQEDSKKISFIAEIDEVSKKLSYFAIGLILLVSLILYIKSVSILSIFLVASALIIGSIPEGLPAIVVFLLSKSVHRLAKKEILVKDIGLLETLGSIDILCTDKTGTLTENKMSLKRLYIGGEEINYLSQINNKYKNILIDTITYVNNIKIVENKLEGDPEDIALVHYIKNEDNNFNLNNHKNEKNIKCFEPFNSENKYSYCQLDTPKLTLKKGAAEVLLKSSKYIILNNKKELITPQIIKNIENQMKSFTNEALRLIAFSYSDFNGKNEVFLGFCGLYDKPKVGIKNTVETLYHSGIEIKMITGDSIDTAKAIGVECGFKNINAINYDQIIKLDKNEFEKAALKYNIFARMTPELKFRILDVLKKNSHRVAITGDGVNDSIALKHADVGIVMGSGSDIAKQSGDLILINNDFRTLPNAIEEGRGIFHNIRKVVNYLLTANLAEVLTIFVSAFFGLIPFTAIQILWVNFVTDVAPSMALGVDKFPKHIMKSKPNGKNEQILNIRIILLTIFISLKKVALIFILFITAYKYSPIENSLIFAQTVAFSWLVLTHFVRIAAIRFDEKVAFFSNKYVNYSLLFVIFLQLIILYTPFRNFFTVTPLPIIWVLILIIFIFIGIFLAKLITMFISYLLKNYFKETENY